MQPEVGAVLEGKVSGVTKFGAFVNLPGDKSGLVHISEIANTFVSDVAQYVSVGQTVKVKVIGINGDKINLSIKRAEESKEAPRRRAPQQRSEQQSRPPKQPQQPSGASKPPAVCTDGQMADFALRPSGRVVQKPGNAVRVRQAEHLPGSDCLPEFFIRRDAARQRVELFK